MPDIVFVASLVLAGAAVPAEREPPLCVGWGHVFFESGSVVVDRGAAGILDNFVHVLRQSVTPSHVELVGHADRAGSEEVNLSLSRRRATAVRDYLLARGVSPSLIRIEAAGEARGLVDTPDGTVEPHNRRVEFSERPAPAEWQRREAWWAKHGTPTIFC